MTDVPKKTITYSTTVQKGLVTIEIHTSDGGRVSINLDPPAARQFGLQFVHAAYEAEKDNG